MVEAAPLSAPVPEGPKKRKQENVKKSRRTIWSIENFSKCWPGYVCGWFLFVLPGRPEESILHRDAYEESILKMNLQIENNPNNKNLKKQKKQVKTKFPTHIYGTYMDGMRVLQVRFGSLPPLPERVPSGGVNTGGIHTPASYPADNRKRPVAAGTFSSSYLHIPLH